MMSKIKPLMNQSVLFWQDVQTPFPIFTKNSRNAIPKYEHVIVPHVSSISTFIPELYRQCCADFIKCKMEHPK